jgi:hypothetical protein
MPLFALAACAEQAERQFHKRGTEESENQRSRDVDEAGASRSRDQDMQDAAAGPHSMNGYDSMGQAGPINFATHQFQMPGRNPAKRQRMDAGGGVDQDDSMSGGSGDTHSVYQPALMNGLHHHSNGSHGGGSSGQRIVHSETMEDGYRWRKYGQKTVKVGSQASRSTEQANHIDRLASPSGESQQCQSLLMQTNLACVCIGSLLQQHHYGLPPFQDNPSGTPCTDLPLCPAKRNMHIRVPSTLAATTSAPIQTAPSASM